jgi:hypothetical protein
VNSELVNLNDNVKCEKFLDIGLDMNELLELHNMTIRPWVRQILLTTIINLRKELMNRKCKLQYEGVPKPKEIYSEVVSNSSTKFSSKERKIEATVRNIPMIITTQNSQMVETKQNGRTLTP